MYVFITFRTSLKRCINVLSRRKSNLQNATMADGKEDFSDLAPNQRRKKLKQKVEELQNKVAQETAARDGLLKMKSVYESNSALGNPMTVEGTTLFFFTLLHKQIILESKENL